MSAGEKANGAGAAQSGEGAEREPHPCMSLSAGRAPEPGTDPRKLHLDRLKNFPVQ